MKEQIADIVTGTSKQLQGFKVLGIFPFYLKFITTGTHIKLAKIRAQIDALTESEPKVSDFTDPELMAKIKPLMDDYILTGLLNGRAFSWFFYFLLKRKIKECSHAQILNLFLVIQSLNEPAFFFTYWNLITKKDHTLLREVKQ